MGWRWLGLWLWLLMLLRRLAATLLLLVVLRVCWPGRRKRIHKGERKACAKSSQHARTPILGGLPAHVSLV